MENDRICLVIDIINAQGMGIRMKLLTVQIKPDKSPEFDELKIIKRFEKICFDLESVNSVEVQKGNIDGNYLNLRCETDDVHALWQKIKSELFTNSFTGPILKKATIIFYEDDECQDDHVLLYHFDPSIPVDTIEES